MSAPATKGLDFAAAWSRVRKESNSRPYLAGPYELPLVEIDTEAWLGKIEERVTDGRYQPSAYDFLELPKGGGAVRPIARLTLADRVVYNAALGACMPSLSETLAWSQGEVDFSHQLRPDGPGWLEAQVGGWDRFRRRSLAHLEHHGWILATDITAFYENIALDQLVSALREAGAPDDAVALLSYLLNRWALVDGRGLPQGAQASDILSKLYLNSFDLELRNAGVTHVRYSDDIRVFAKSREQALAWHRDLARALRARGLHLQPAKTYLLTQDQAKDHFDGVVPTLRAIRLKFAAEIDEVFGIDDPYMEITDIQNLFASDNPNDAPIEVLRSAFNTYFVKGDPKLFDKTLFRFLLNRLGAAQDPEPLPHITRYLVDHPEETETVLTYLRRFGATEETQGTLVSFLRSDAGQLYDYQTQQILESLDSRSHSEDSPAMQIARDLLADPSTSRYVRAVARRMVGRNGNVGDLHAIQLSYRSAIDELEKAQVLCSLKRLERGRRNAFLARARDDGELTSRAVRFVRAAHRGD